jgi:hypothetical protein
MKINTGLIGFREGKRYSRRGGDVSKQSKNRQQRNPV